MMPIKKVKKVPRDTPPRCLRSRLSGASLIGHSSVYPPELRASLCLFRRKRAVEESKAASSKSRGSSHSYGDYTLTILNPLAAKSKRIALVSGKSHMAFELVARRESETVRMKHDSSLIALAKARVWASEGWNVTIVVGDENTPKLVQELDLSISSLTQTV
jgi:hypothetical protein